MSQTKLLGVYSGTTHCCPRSLRSNLFVDSASQRRLNSYISRTYYLGESCEISTNHNANNRIVRAGWMWWRRRANTCTHCHQRTTAYLYRHFATAANEYRFANRHAGGKWGKRCQRFRQPVACPRRGDCQCRAVNLAPGKPTEHRLFWLATHRSLGLPRS